MHTKVLSYIDTFIEDISIPADTKAKMIFKVLLKEQPTKAFIKSLRKAYRSFKNKEPEFQELFKVIGEEFHLKNRLCEANKDKIVILFKEYTEEQRSNYPQTH